MEWVETTAKTIEEAKERALDQLGVADEDAEFEVLEEPKAGLFGLIRGEARLRARVRPTEARPKVDRRRGRKSDRAKAAAGGGSAASATVDTPGSDAGDDDASQVDAGDDASQIDDAGDAGQATSPAGTETAVAGGGRRGESRDARRGRGRRGGRDDERDDERDRGRDDGRDDGRTSEVEPAAVGAAAVAFMEGLVEAFGVTATVELEIDGTELDVRVDGADLGLLIGPGGRTLLAVQDLARVAAQRRLGDHDTRLRIDVAGYRERRRAALERFAHSVAEQVIDTGRPRSLEPMPSADRKVVHDVLVEIEGVDSHSEGDDPFRRVVVTPA